MIKIFVDLKYIINVYLDSDVLIGSDDGYGLRNPDGVEYTDGVCLKKKIQNI